MSLSARLHMALDRFVLDAELQAEAGVTALFGPSGSGKTTLLRCLAGLEGGAEGFLEVAGERWQDSERGMFVPPHRRAVGYVFQHTALLPHRRVRANLRYGYDRVPAADRRVGFDATVALLGLGPLLDRRPARLSGGERQRVAIGRALLASPRLLLLDEPLASLDRAGKADILPFLDRLRRELAVPMVYVTHTTEEVVRLADELVLLESGRVQAAGPLGELATRLDLPLARAEDAEAVVAAQVAEHDDAYGLTYLTFVGGRLAVPRRELAPGTPVRVGVHARDVSLTLDPPERTSILNVVPATVTELAADGEAGVLVRLEAGGVPLLARITRKSRDQLGLAPNTAVYAQVKSVALAGE